MRQRDEPPPATDVDDTKQFPTRGWTFLVWAMGVLGILFLMSGIVLLCQAILAALLLGANLFFWLLLLGWGAVPILAGFLLLHAAERLASPARGSGTLLVVVAASTFAGLAWAAITAVLYLNSNFLN
jgi:hypothetical protein